MGRKDFELAVGRKKILASIIVILGASVFGVAVLARNLNQVDAANGG